MRLVVVILLLMIEMGKARVRVVRERRIVVMKNFIVEYRLMGVLMKETF